MNYFLVDEAPETLEKNEMVIPKPDFKDQIQASKLRRGVKKLTTVNALRDALMLITDKYDNTINPYRLTLINYEGLPFETDDDLAGIVLQIIADNNLDLVPKAVDYYLKNRPKTVDTVYYVGDDDSEVASTFIANGFSAGKKSKKITKKEETVV